MDVEKQLTTNLKPEIELNSYFCTLDEQHIITASVVFCLFIHSKECRAKINTLLYTGSCE